MKCKLAQLNGNTLVSSKRLEMAIYLGKFIALYMYVLYFNENFTKYEVGYGKRRIKIYNYKPVLLYITYS